MKAKILIHLLRKLTPFICLLLLTAAIRSSAQGVFQSSIGYPGISGGGLTMGQIYFRVDHDEVEFTAFIQTGGSLTASLTPKLIVPGSSLDFTLGDGVASALHGSHTVADNNPYLPSPPWLPAGYDDGGNPIYLDVAMIRYGDLYSGRFALPTGFLDELRAGHGRVEFNSSLGGSIIAVPEPTACALIGLGVAILFIANRRSR